MKLVHGIGLATTLTFASAGAWLGCSSDDSSTGSTNDAGTSADTSVSNTDTGTTPGADTGTTPGTDSGGGSDAGTGGETSVALDCTSYCNGVMAACTGANQQYATVAECMNACAFFPTGTAADTTGNTLGCRVYHTGLAGSLPQPHCWHAGPFGLGACGSTCDNFCALTLGWCGPDAGIEAGAPYPSAAACASACPGFALVDGGADAGISAYSATGPAGGNTLDCRMYHLGYALQSAVLQQVHCPHTAIDSGVCY
jgi:hypothetical protein